MYIVDTETDEVVVNGSVLLPNEKRVGEPLLGLEQLVEDGAEGEFWGLLRHFRNKAQPKYERENYQPEEINDK